MQTNTINLLTILVDEVRYNVEMKNSLKVNSWKIVYDFCIRNIYAQRSALLSAWEFIVCSAWVQMLIMNLMLNIKIKFFNTFQPTFCK